MGVPVPHAARPSALQDCVQGVTTLWRTQMIRADNLRQAREGSAAKDGRERK